MRTLIAVLLIALSIGALSVRACQDHVETVEVEALEAAFERADLEPTDSNWADFCELLAEAPEYEGLGSQYRAECADPEGDGAE